MADSSNTVGNVVKLAGEVVLPGLSQYADGNIKSGVAYSLTGLAARVLLGPVGALCVSADSYSNSVPGKHLYEHIIGND